MDIDQTTLLAVIGKKTLELELVGQELERLKKLYEDSQLTVEELQQRLRSMTNGG